MGTIANFNQRIQRVDFRSTVILCMEQSQYEILSFNRGQLFMGETSTDKLISPMYRSEGYAEFKESINPKPGKGVPDLFVTGEFYNGLFVSFNKVKYTFTVASRDSKAPKLERKYGEKIYGLNSENKGYFATEILKPKLIARLRTELCL